MGDVDDAVQEAVERAREGSRLNTWVAVLVALTATLMALGNIKDDNIVQAMDFAHGKANDQWSFYQAKSLKQHLAEFGREQALLQVEAGGAAGPARAVYEKAIKDYEAQVKRYEGEKEGIAAEARKQEAEYDRLNVHDDQFDMADALFSIAIALGGITALTQRKWLFWMATGLAVTGALFTAAGYLGLAIHPGWLARLFGA